jgi:hypothetical protein
VQRPALAPCLAALADTAFAAAPDRPAPARPATAWAGVPPNAGRAGGCATREGFGPDPAPSADLCGGVCALGPAAAWRGGTGLGGPAGVHDAVQAHANGGGRWQACWARAPDGRLCPVWAALPPGWRAPPRPPGGMCGQPPPPPHPPPGDPPQGPGSRPCQAAHAFPPQPAARRRASPAPGCGASAAGGSGAGGGSGNRAAAARLRARLRAVAAPAADAPLSAAAGRARGEERAGSRGGCPLTAAAAADGAAQGAAAVGGPEPHGSAPGRPAGVTAAVTVTAAGGAAVGSPDDTALPGTSSVLEPDTGAPVAAGGQVAAGASARHKRALGEAETDRSVCGKRHRAEQRAGGSGGGGACGSGTLGRQSGWEAAGQDAAGAWAAAGSGDGAAEQPVPPCLQVELQVGLRMPCQYESHLACTVFDIEDATQASVGTPRECAAALG